MDVNRDEKDNYNYNNNNSTKCQILRQPIIMIGNDYKIMCHNIIQNNDFDMNEEDVLYCVVWGRTDDETCIISS